MKNPFKLESDDQTDQLLLRLPPDAMSRLFRGSVAVIFCGTPLMFGDADARLIAASVLVVAVYALWAESYFFKVCSTAKGFDIVASRFVFGRKRLSFSDEELGQVSQVPWLGPAPWIVIRFKARRGILVRVSSPYLAGTSSTQQRVIDWFQRHKNRTP